MTELWCFLIPLCEKWAALLLKWVNLYSFVRQFNNFCERQQLGKPCIRVVKYGRWKWRKENFFFLSNFKTNSILRYAQNIYFFYWIWVSGGDSCEEYTNTTQTGKTKRCRNKQAVRRRQESTQKRLGWGSVLMHVIVCLVWMWRDGHSALRCYLAGLWGELSFFGSLDLFTTETRHLRSGAFVVQHAKHTVWTSLNSLTRPAGGKKEGEFMPVHLSGLVCFYSSTGCVLKVCVFAFTALMILLFRYGWRKSCKTEDAWTISH